MKRRLNKKGFTLIELIVVIAILAILALILVPTITGYITKANNAKNQANSRSEYSRLVLEHWTNDGVLLQRNGTTAVVTATSYALTSELDCTATYTTAAISAFACTDGTLTWSLANDFTP